MSESTAADGLALKICTLHVVSIQSDVYELRCKTLQVRIFSFCNLMPYRGGSCMVYKNISEMIGASLITMWFDKLKHFLFFI